MSSYTKTYITYDIETIGLPFDSFDEARKEYSWGRHQRITGKKN